MKLPYSIFKIPCPFFLALVCIFLLSSCGDEESESPAPVINSFTPSSGILGTLVTITGNNFSVTPEKNIVKFNGAIAVVSGATETTLAVIVPAEASPGKISVTVNGKTATSSTDFTLPLTSITDFYPAIGAPGISVTINGSNFSPVIGNNAVRFNGTVATVTAASPTQLTATVPNSATSGTLTVTVGIGTANSSSDFEVCTGSAELLISDVVVSNTTGATSYTVSFKITNVGSSTADISKILMQNYASQDELLGGDDVAASGYTLTNGPMLASGQSFTTDNYGCNISGGTTTSHPYLILTIMDAPDGSVPECNTDNNVAIRPFN